MTWKIKVIQCIQHCDLKKRTQERTQEVAGRLLAAPGAGSETHAARGATEAVTGSSVACVEHGGAVQSVWVVTCLAVLNARHWATVCKTSSGLQNDDSWYFSDKINLGKF